MNLEGGAGRETRRTEEEKQEEERVHLDVSYDYSHLVLFESIPSLYEFCELSRWVSYIESSRLS